MGRRTIRRTFDANRFCLGDLESVRTEAYGKGLDNTAIVGFKARYADGWKVDVTVNGDVNANIAPSGPPPICPECRDGKHSNCTEWTLSDDDNIVDCRCAHDD